MVQYNTLKGKKMASRVGIFWFRHAQRVLERIQTNSNKFMWSRDVHVGMLIKYFEFSQPPSSVSIRLFKHNKTKKLKCTSHVIPVFAYLVCCKHGNWPITACIDTTYSIIYNRIQHNSTQKYIQKILLMTNHGHLKTILLHLFVDTRPSNYLMCQLCWFCHYLLV